jgi:hypothetical protein
MVPITSLVLPILLSAVLVFLASFVMHMVLTYHRSDWKKVPKEDEAMEALRRLNVPPGDYMMPCGEGPASMKDPAFVAKMTTGPIVLMNVRPGGPPAMGKNLVMWFIYSIVVSIFAAYIAGRAVPPGGEYLEAFRFAGCTAFLGYSMAQAHESIWFNRAWSSTIKTMCDGLVYGLLTGGAFGWLWPR